jgi:predicted transcriptional regulator
VIARPTGHRESRRVDDVLRVICLYAQENPGGAPTTRQIARELNLSQQRVSYLMMRLERLGRITWLTRYTYRINQSVWEPPPDIDI